MSDANRPIASRFNVPDAFWHGLTLIGLEPAMVLRQARLPVTLGIRELRDRRQVSTQEFFRLWEAVHVLNPDPAAGTDALGDRRRREPSRGESGQRRRVRRRTRTTTPSTSAAAAPTTTPIDSSWRRLGLSDVSGPPGSPST